MGERVVIDPAAQGAERTARQQQSPPPRPAVPLDYGHAESKLSGAEVLVRRLGGWRRIVFSLGTGCLAAGFAYGTADWPQSDVAAMLAGLGGLLVGLAAPLKGLAAPGGE